VTIGDEGDFSKTFLTTMVEVYVEEERASVEVKGRRWKNAYEQLVPKSSWKWYSSRAK